MDGISPLPQAALNPYVFQLLQTVDQEKEQVSGISKLSQGLNRDAISTQNAEGKIEQLINASMSRQKVIARRFGAFIRDIYDLVYHTAVDHIDEATYIAVTGKYVEVNPVEWKERTAASIELSLGYGDEDKEANKYIEIDTYLTQHPAMQNGGYTPEQRHYVLSKVLESRGIEEVEQIITPPAQVPPSEPSEQEVIQLETLRSQKALIDAQAQAMLMKAETEKLRAETERMKVEIEGRAKTQKALTDADRLEHDKELGWAELEEAKLAEDKRGILSPS
jgi:hypothetical protein